MPQLIHITTLKATLEVITGLRVGAGDSEMHIGGIDNTVIKHPHTQAPYIPGSSIKGKMRSLLEWRSGAVQENPLGKKDHDKATGTTRAEVFRILQLFGMAGGDTKDDEKFLAELGPTRLSFWDCNLNAEWVKQTRDNNLSLTEVKSENRINRISGTASDPRQTERVPAGTLFDFRLSVKRCGGDGDALINTVLQGLKLIELDSLGGSGSRGYGKVKFKQFQIDGKDGQARLDAIQAFEMQP